MTDLNKLHRLFQNMSRPLVLEANKRQKDRTIDGLKELNFFMTSISITPKQVIKIQLIDKKEFSIYMANEASRFFLASMVSLGRAKQHQPHNLAWQLVEHYYAAYYAVHYLMRVGGYSITNIDKATLQCILKTNVSQQNTSNLSAGLNLLKFDMNCEHIEIIKKEKGGGSHKNVWEIWSEIVESLLELTKKDIQEYSNIAMSLAEHRSFLVRTNGTYSPTEIRSEINYQFKGNSWCFEEKTKDKINRITRAISENSIVLSKDNDLLYSFTNHNNFIISLAKSVFQKASQNNGKSICRGLTNQFKDRVIDIVG
ncbi:hypothetical protein [Aeromonas enteropelogenes]|uniref:hypothetical protein n=1 Tax=Aeromonas enteropelogenes TaxID=29489 RepID=UPI003BA34D1E